MTDFAEFNGLDEANLWLDNLSEEDIAASREQHFVNRDIGAYWLILASNQGNGPASVNLAGAYLDGYGNLAWEESKDKARALFLKAKEQGFPFIEWFCLAQFPNTEDPLDEYFKMMDEARQLKASEPGT